MGSSDITVQETTTIDATGSGDPIIGYTDLWVSKFPGTFSLTNFRVEPPQIKPGDAVQLYWDVLLAGCTLTLYGDPNQPQGVDVTNLTSYPADPDKTPLILQENTQFILKALVPQYGENYFYDVYAAVNVLVPQIISFTPDISKTLAGNKITLNWAAEFIDHCVLQVDGATIAQSLSTTNPQSHGQFEVNPDATTTYSLQGQDAKNNIITSNTTTTVQVYGPKLIGNIYNSATATMNTIVSPDGSILYNFVMTVNDPSITQSLIVINTKSNNQVIANIPLPIASRSLAMKPDGSIVFVGSGVGYFSEGTNVISVYDTSKITSNNPLVLTINLLSNQQVGWMVPSPDGSKLYVMIFQASGNCELLIYETTNYSNIANIPLQSESDISDTDNQVAVISSDGLKLYFLAANGAKSANRIMWFDLAKQQENSFQDSLTFSLSTTCSLALSNDGLKLYVVDPQASAISILDTQKYTLIKTIVVDSSPSTLSLTRLALSPDGIRLYVVASGEMQLIDSDSYNIVTIIKLDVPLLTCLALNRDESKLYITSGDSAGNSYVFALWELDVAGALIPEIKAPPENAPNKLSTNPFCFIAHIGNDQSRESMTTDPSSPINNMEKNTQQQRHR